MTPEERSLMKQFISAIEMMTGELKEYEIAKTLFRANPWGDPWGWGFYGGGCPRGVGAPGGWVLISVFDLANQGKVVAP